LALFVIGVAGGVGIFSWLSPHDSPVAPAVSVSVAPAPPVPESGATTTPSSPVSRPPASSTHRPPGHQTPLVSAEASTSFSALTASAGGRLGIAVAPLGTGPVRALGSLSSGHAWSAMKVPVLVTLLAERGGRGLSAEQQASARRAVTQSDNQAAIDLFGALQQTHHGLIGASAAVQQTLRRAGDPVTHVNTEPNAGGFTTFGQTTWSAQASTIFYRSLARGCLLSPTDTAYVLDLMARVTGDQRWGMGQADLHGAPLSFKGGWGPEDGGPYLARQTAIVGSGARGYVVSLLAISQTGTFEGATRMLTSAGRWVGRHLDPRLRRPPATCG